MPQIYPKPLRSLLFVKRYHGITIYHAHIVSLKFILPSTTDFCNHSQLLSISIWSRDEWIRSLSTTAPIYIHRSTCISPCTEPTLLSSTLATIVGPIAVPPTSSLGNLKSYTLDDVSASVSQQSAISKWGRGLATTAWSRRLSS